MKTSTATVQEANVSLIDEIVGFTRLSKENENYAIARQGIEVLLKEIFDNKNQKDARVDKNYVDSVIRMLDERLSRQMDEILHHENFQKLESQWRGLKTLVDRTSFSENIKVEMINVSKEDLFEDFKDSAGIIESGLYQSVYTEQFGQFGGEPVGVIIGNFEVTPNAEDIKLLEYMGSLSAMTHAPFITAASPSFFGLEHFEELSQLKQLDAIFDGPQYVKWRALRESDDSRNIGLVMPRFMLRTPYGEENSARSFVYNEKIESKSDYLWGNAAFPYATRLTESFAAYRWCPNIIGPQSGGAVKDLPIHVVNQNGRDEIVGPVETTISDRKEYELSELGFVPFTLRKDSDCAVFFSSSSIQKAKKFGTDQEGIQAELNYKLGTQLPYLFIINRLAHYIKVLQRENLGSWKGRSDIEMELNKWIRQYVADQENPSPSTRSQRPLRKAELEVRESEDTAGWYEVSLSVTPHFKFMGSNFTLSLSSLLERV
jgi:type VI secretion system protein ImpC